MVETESIACSSSLLKSLQRELEDKLSPLNIATVAKICERLGIDGHLAIITEPYLDRILTGRKTTESRFGRSRMPPFKKIRPGDVILFKLSSGPIRALARTSEAQFFGPMHSGEAEQLMEKYRDVLCLEDCFVTQKRDSTYATLIHLSDVLSIPPITVTKSDRRPWVVLRDILIQQPAVQLGLFPNSECASGLHNYHKSKHHNAKGYPVCSACGVDVIDWERLHLRDIQDADYTISQLKTDLLRYAWWTKEFDQQAKNHALRKGLIALRTSALIRLRKSVGEVHEMRDGTRQPYRDGFQTPYSGNSIYYAQHALACCCRKCMKYWHGIPLGRDLTEEELAYFVDLVMLYIQSRIPEIQMSSVFVPASKARASREG